jgi:hypothetical protein
MKLYVVASLFDSGVWCLRAEAEGRQEPLLTGRYLRAFPDRAGAEAYARAVDAALRRWLLLEAPTFPDPAEDGTRLRVGPDRPDALARRFHTSLEALTSWPPGVLHDWFEEQGLPPPPTRPAKPSAAPARLSSWLEEALARAGPPQRASFLLPFDRMSFLEVLEVEMPADP